LRDVNNVSIYSTELRPTVPAVTLTIYLREVSMLSGCPPSQMKFIALHGRAEAEEVHKDHVVVPDKQ